MDEFDRITDAIDQAFAKVMSALAGLITAVTVCGVLTWLGWVCVVIAKWVAG